MKNHIYIYGEFVKILEFTLFIIFVILRSKMANLGYKLKFWNFSEFSLTFDDTVMGQSLAIFFDFSRFLYLFVHLAGHRLAEFGPY